MIHYKSLHHFIKNTRKLLLSPVLKLQMIMKIIIIVIVIVIVAAAVIVIISTLIESTSS